MFNRFAIFVATLFVVALSIPVVVFAQEDATTTNSVEPIQISDQSVQSSEDVTAENRAEKRIERIEAAKLKFNEKLSAAAERRIQSKCKMAQTKIDTLQSSITIVSESRQQVYMDFSTKINELIAKLQVAGVDTKLLEESVNELDGIATTASTTFSEYTSVLSDLSNMDCESDPKGFSALLAEARALRLSVFTLQNDVRAQARQEIKNNLENAKKSLVQVLNNSSEGEDQ